MVPAEAERKRRPRSGEAEVADWGGYLLWAMAGQVEYPCWAVAGARPLENGAVGAVWHDGSSKAGLPGSEAERGLLTRGAEAGGGSCWGK